MKVSSRCVYQQFYFRVYSFLNENFNKRVSVADENGDPIFKKYAELSQSVANSGKSIGSNCILISNVSSTDTFAKKGRN